jgi:hypothetical protein
MLCTATRPRLLSTHLPAPIAPRWSPPSECENAHRGLSGLCRSASAPTRSQVSIASGENSRCCTKARRTPLLPQGNQPTSTVTVTASCPSQNLSLSRPSYWQRVQNDADAANQALGSGVTKLATILGTGALSQQVFGTSGVTPFQTYWAGGEAISTDLGVLSGLGRVGAALAVRAVSGAAVYGAWRVGNYAGAVIGNISLPGGPTITDAVSSAIDFELNGPSGAEPTTCTQP